MMTPIDDYPVEVAGRIDHRQQTNRAHHQLNACVYSGHYETLQAAVNDAIAKRRPLLIEPKQHLLTAPLVIEASTDLALFGYGASLVAGANMPSLIDLDGAAFFSVHGLNLTTTNNHAVDNMIYLRSWATVGTVTTQCLFERIWITGRYVVGVRIGTPGSNSQCDTTHWRKLIVNGGGRDDSTLWQYGVYCGSDTASNNLNHKFYDAQISSHNINLIVSGTDCEVYGGDLGHANIDVHHKTSQKLSIAGIRTEGSRQFMSGTGRAMVTTNTSLSQIQCHMQDLNEDGRWIDYSTSGHLSLAHIQCLNVPDGRTAVIYADPPYPLSITAEHVTMPTPLSSAFDCDWQKVRVNLTGFADVNIQTAHMGRLHHNAAGVWYREVIDANGVLSLEAV